MLISDALKETGKATRTTSARVEYAALYRGILYWFDENNNPMEPLTFYAIINRGGWQPYHPKEEIRPSEAGELWVKGESKSRYMTTDRQTDISTHKCLWGKCQLIRCDSRSKWLDTPVSRGEVMLISDELLEFYGDIFVNAGFRTFSNITFEQFLTRPDYHLDKLMMSLNG